jgi:hypothetical protein
VGWNHGIEGLRLGCCGGMNPRHSGVKTRMLWWNESTGFRGYRLGCCGGMNPRHSGV